MLTKRYKDKVNMAYTNFLSVHIYVSILENLDLCLLFSLTC